MEQGDKMKTIILKKGTLVVEVVFDKDGILDSVMNKKTGNLLAATHPMVKQIAINASAIYCGGQLPKALNYQEKETK